MRLLVSIPVYWQLPLYHRLSPSFGMTLFHRYDSSACWGSTVLFLISSPIIQSSSSRVCVLCVFNESASYSKKNRKWIRTFFYFILRFLLFFYFFIFYSFRFVVILFSPYNFFLSGFRLFLFWVDSPLITPGCRKLLVFIIFFKKIFCYNLFNRTGFFIYFFLHI